MRVLKPDEMRMIDNYSIEELKIQQSVLMYAAAKSVFDEICNMKNVKSLVVVAGNGNNGGDAFVLARLLGEAGYMVKVLLVSSYDEYKDEAKATLDILIKLDFDVKLYEGKKIGDADVIVDGIFGTGFRGDVEGVYMDIIDEINAHMGYKISIDVPSGINGFNGIGAQSYIKADLTITFGAFKTGFFQNDAINAVGMVKVKDIGFPKKAFDLVESKIQTVESDFIKKLLPKRERDSNKGSFGKAIIIAGSKKMAGAGIMATASSLRVGCGKTAIATIADVIGAYNIKIPEAIAIPLASTENGNISKDDIPLIKKEAENCSCVAVGPGMGKNESTRDIVLELLKIEGLKLIIDADGLNSLKDHLSSLKNAKAQVAITPHPGEMARLVDKTVQEVLANRIDVCAEFSKEYNVITLLKGYNSIISSPDGKVYINMTGNSALAKSGSGDVLCGMITGFGAYMDLFESVLISVHIHGLCSDIYIKDKSSISMMASQIIDLIPFAVKELEN